MGDGSQISTSVTIINSLLGYQAISLSEMDSSAATVIKAGSKVEIASAFFTFKTDNTPQATTWTPISNYETAYITLTPQGDAGSQTLVTRWSSDAPTWSDSKQGWYDSTSGSVIRYVGSVYRHSGNYLEKTVLVPIRRGNDTLVYTDSGGSMSLRRFMTTILEIGAWNMNVSVDGVASVTLNHELTNSNIMTVEARIIADGGTDIFMLPAPNGTGQEMVKWNASIITLQCATGGTFDGAGFNGASNRGFVVITHMQD